VPRRTLHCSSVASGGDYIPTGTALTASQLGLSSSQRTVTLYLEGVAASTSVGDQEIKVDVNPNGGQGAASSDSARVTLMSVNIDNVDASVVDLSWTGPTDAQSYNILRAPQSDPTNLTTVGSAGPNDGFYQDTTATPATQYVYRIEAAYADGTTARSAPTEVTTLPLAPINLGIASVSASGVSLNWQPDPNSTRQPDDYAILRSDDSNPTNLVQIATVSGGTTSFVDTAVSPGVHYYYEVSADWQNLNSGTAETATAFVAPAAPPIAPTALSGAPDASGASIDLAWTNNDPGTARLRLDRSKDYGQTFQTIAYVAPVLTSYQDPYVAAGGTYVYRVSAENAAGISAPTNTATVVAPIGAAGEQGDLPLPGNSIPTTLTGQWVGDIYADGQYASGGTKTEISMRMNLDQAAAQIQHDGYTDRISVMSLNDGFHAVFHVYKYEDYGQKYLGPYIFDAADSQDMADKLKEAENAAFLGQINDAANTAAQLVEVGVTVTTTLVPGPDDVLIGALVTKAVTKFASWGTKATWQAGKWVFQKAGQALAGDAERKATQELRSLTLEQLGANQITWAPGVRTLSQQYAKHIPRSNAWTRDIIKATRHSEALYKPGQDIEMLERSVWQSGTPVTSGKNWKVYEFDHVIGACDGKEVRWVRVEGTGGPGNAVIHGRPITQEDYRRLTK